MLRHVWQGGADANEPARLAALKVQLQPLRDPADESVKLSLRQATDAAQGLGVFGVPTIEFEGRLFWGFDALPMLADAMRGGPWFDGPDWEREGELRPGIQRAG